MIASSVMVIVVVIVSSSVLFCAVVFFSTSVPCGFFPLGVSVSSVLFSTVVDSFHFRAVWILSTDRLSVVRVV